MNHNSEIGAQQCAEINQIMDVFENVDRLRAWQNEAGQVYVTDMLQSADCDLGTRLG